MIEHVILVDDSDRAVGVREKLLAHREGALHRAFSAFVFDRRGRLLLQRRADGKYHSGGLWSNSACGHPRPGETVLEAGRRRLREEVGVSCELASLYGFVYAARLDNDLTEREYDHVLVGEYSGPVVADPSEVGEWAWVAREPLLRAVRANPGVYTYWFKEAIGEVASRVGVRFR